MTADAFKVTIHMVSSLDGIIAKKDNSVSWFESTDTYEKGVTDLEMEDYFKTIDCYIMGALTYEHAVELSTSFGWPYGDVPTVVVTHRNLPIDRKNIELYSGDLVKLVNEKLKPKYNNVWVVGGAILINEFLRLNLVDEIRLIVMPIILGDGKPFFDHIGKEQLLHLRDVIAYKTGMVELWYEIR